MTQRRRLLWLGFVALSLFLLANRGEAGGDGKKDVDVITAAVAKGDDAGAKKMAEALVKKNEDALFDSMVTMKPTTDKKPGFPVGKSTEGIEKTVQELAKNGAKDLKKNSEALLEMANRINAIAHVAQATKQKKSPAVWTKYANSMNELSKDLAKAIKAGDAPGVQKIAAKLDANCNQCHEKFR